MTQQDVHGDRQRLPKIWVCTHRTSQGKDIELILTIKIETRNYTAFVIITELCRPEVARPWNFVSSFAFFLEKRPLSNCRYGSDRAQNLPGPAPDIWLKPFQISSKSVNFRPNAWRPFLPRTVFRNRETYTIKIKNASIYFQTLQNSASEDVLGITIFEVFSCCRFCFYTLTSLNFRVNAGHHVVQLCLWFRVLWNFSYFVETWFLTFLLFTIQIWIQM